MAGYSAAIPAQVQERRHTRCRSLRMPMSTRQRARRPTASGQLFLNAGLNEIADVMNKSNELVSKQRKVDAVIPVTMIMTITVYR